MCIFSSSYIIFKDSSRGSLRIACLKRKNSNNKPASIPVCPIPAKPANASGEYDLPVTWKNPFVTIIPIVTITPMLYT